jgi:hypothetical protein
MAYSEALAERIRGNTSAHEGVSEIKMFGGLAFMVGGNMFCGIIGDELMARVGSDNFDEALGKPGARIMDFSGRPMKGMLFVGSSGIDSDRDLKAWVDASFAYATALPVKVKKPKAPAKRKVG